jgi:hypothetical protein
MKAYWSKLTLKSLHRILSFISTLHPLRAKFRHVFMIWIQSFKLEVENDLHSLQEMVGVYCVILCTLSFQSHAMSTLLESIEWFCVLLVYKVMKCQFSLESIVWFCAQLSIQSHEMSIFWESIMWLCAQLSIQSHEMWFFWESIVWFCVQIVSKVVKCQLFWNLLCDFS